MIRRVFIFGLISFSILISLALISSPVNANDTVVDKVNITVPMSCSFSDEVISTDTPHTKTMQNNDYQSEIGTTTFKTYCNDLSGYSVYAIGYSNDEYGNTLMKHNSDSNNDFNTGTATSGNTSEWAMKLIPVSGTYAPTIQSDTSGSFASYHVVPTTYTKVATFPSQTDAPVDGTPGIGSAFKSTYAAWISATQPAGTYTGKVRYTLVHPANHVAPVPVSKNLYYAITGEANNYTLTISDSDITSGAVAGGPVNVNGYNASYNVPWYSSYSTQIKSVVVNGTVAPTSTAYWFNGLENCDSWNLAGLKTDNVTNMSYMFSSAGYNATTFTLDLSSWNTEKVTNMHGMFAYAGYNATTWSVGDLSNWNTANVTNMSSMFEYAGYNATTWSIGDLSAWNTANVTNMSSMFYCAGYVATTWSVGDLSNWNTANVTNMSSMFAGAGRNATTFVLNLSSWNTASVTDMSYMFQQAGYSATTWSVGDLSSWNTAKVTNMEGMFQYAGYSATAFALDFSSWNTANVTNMSSMFSYAGRNTNTFTIDLSSWNTSSVTNMSSMFGGAGYSATSWSVTIPRTNGASSNPISNTTTNLYGQTTSVTVTPLSGKSFTLAQP